MTRCVSPELLPCPFCGSKRITAGYEGQPWVKAFIACADCRCQGESVAGGDFNLAVKEAAEKWNRRAPVEKKEPQ